MKKILILAVSAIALTASTGNAAVKEGFNVSLMPGFSKNFIKLKETDLESNKTKNKNAFDLDLALGYQWAIKERCFFGVRLLGGYNFANVKLARSNNGDFVRFKPGFNFGVGILAGQFVSENMSIYAGLNLTRERTRIEKREIAVRAASEKARMSVLSLTPLVGINGKITENLSWLGEVGYKIGVNKAGLKKNARFAEIRSNLKKPRALIAKVGVTYQF